MRTLIAILVLTACYSNCFAQCFTKKDCVIPDDQAAGTTQIDPKEVVPGMPVSFRWRCIASERKALDQKDDNGTVIEGGENCGDKKWYDVSWVPGTPGPWKKYDSCGEKAEGTECEKKKL